MNESPLFDVILRSFPTITACNYFDKCNVTRMLVIERPMGNPQLYVASGLRDKFHFSIPTVAVPMLHQFIRNQNNKHVKIMVIPRTCRYFESDCCLVLNEVAMKKSVCRRIDIRHTYETTVKASQNSATKCSKHSMSIGQQTIYSHQQHTARYCMLPRSKPHIPTVKHRPKCIRLAMLTGYKYSLQLLANCSDNLELDHPFLWITEMTNIMLPRGQGFDRRSYVI
jgi:hypothetical protein